MIITQWNKCFQEEESHGILEHMSRAPSPHLGKSGKDFSTKAIKYMGRVYWSGVQSISFKVSRHLEKQTKGLLCHHGIRTNGYN